MLVGDLVHNDDFDLNCNYIVYDCREKNSTWHDGKILFSTFREGWTKPLDRILDMRIKYITLNGESVVIEAT